MTRKQNYFMVFILLVLASCKTGQEKKADIQFIKRAEVDSLGSRYLELGRFSGVILITKGDAVLYNDHFGLADYENQIPFSDQTSFKIGKARELITVNIIRDLAQNQKVRLSDPINKYLPEIEATYTIEDLLDREVHSQEIDSTRKAFPELDSSAVEYANLANEKDGTAGKNILRNHVLKLVIERISEKTFQEVLQEYSSRVGLQNTGFQKEDPNAAVGYLYHNNRGNGLELERSTSQRSEAVFSSTIRSTAKDLAAILDQVPDEKIDIEGYLEDDGFSYAIRKDLKTGINIIVLSNRRHPVANEISESIGAIYRDEPYKLPLPRKPFNLNPSLLKEYAGTYALNEQFSLEVLMENDSLYILLGPNKTGLIPQSINQFYMKERDASIRFIVGPDKRVQKAVLLDGFLEGTEITRL